MQNNNSIKNKIVKEIKEIRQKIKWAEGDMCKFQEDYPDCYVLFKEINNKISLIKEEAENIVMWRHGKDRNMEEIFKLFDNNSDFKFSVISQFGHNISMLEMEDIYEAFNLALFIWYICYIADKLGIYVHDGMDSFVDQFKIVRDEVF